MNTNEEQKTISELESRIACQMEVDRCMRVEIAHLTKENGSMRDKLAKTEEELANVTTKLTLRQLDLEEEKSKHNETRKELSVTMMQLANAIKELEENVSKSTPSSEKSRMVKLEDPIPKIPDDDYDPVYYWKPVFRGVSDLIAGGHWVWMKSLYGFIGRHTCVMLAPEWIDVLERPTP